MLGKGGGLIHLFLSQVVGPVDQRAAADRKLLREQGQMSRHEYEMAATLKNAEEAKANQLLYLADRIENGVKKYGRAVSKKTGLTFLVYETDGLGKVSSGAVERLQGAPGSNLKKLTASGNILDEANMPNLLWLPTLPDAGRMPVVDVRPISGREKQKRGDKRGLQAMDIEPIGGGDFSPLKTWVGPFDFGHFDIDTTLDDPGLYNRTRTFALWEKANPVFFRAQRKNETFSGLGSWHVSRGLRHIPDSFGEIKVCDLRCVWPLGLITTGMTASTNAEKGLTLQKVLRTVQRGRFFPEGVSADDVTAYNRDSFGWAEAWFSMWVIREMGGREVVFGGSEFSPVEEVGEEGGRGRGEGGEDLPGGMRMSWSGIFDRWWM